MDQSRIGYQPQSSSISEAGGGGNDNGSNNNNHDKETNQEQQHTRMAEDDSIPISMFTLKQFRSMLVENFNFLFLHEQVVWPK